MSSPNHTPLPIPQFFNEYNSLATKKQRYSSTPKPQLPPRPPSKSITQHSRLSFTFNNSQQNQKAQIISFKYEDPPQLSPLYDRNSKESYLKQCYHIEEKIGSGSFGDVFRVKSRWDQKHYAVKVSREKFKGKIDREEKLNEVCKHEQLPNHDHLVKLHCAWEEKQRLYIETELCAGTLSTLAENNHDMPEELVWAYLVDLLKAIDHLHSNNLIHLDIKPENIFISRDGVCKLGDFGLIFDIDNHHLKEAMEGDPKYLAGEIMQGIFTKSADIFSLGMTILEIAFDLDLPSRGEAWHLLRDGKIPENLFKDRSDLKTIITMMLNPDYERRPTARELLDNSIIKQHERRRRQELVQKKIMKSFRDKLQSIDMFLNDPKNGYAFYYLWSSVKRLVNIITMPLRYIWGLFYGNGCNQNSLLNNNKKSSSPVNYNKTYVSNYLDQYSDDESMDATRFLSKLSFEMSSSSDDEMFGDNLSNKNLCSTVNRDQNPRSLRNIQTPKLSPFNSNGSENPNYESLKSVIQRLTFDDEFSSDEMEMSETDDDRNNERAILSSSLDSSPKANLSIINGNCHQKLSSLRNSDNMRILKNISRKNLMKTFDEIDELKT